MFEFNNKNVKKILLIITYAVLLSFALYNIKYVAYLVSLFKPFIIGFAIAFILNIPLTKFEKWIKKRKSLKRQKQYKGKKEEIKSNIKNSKGMRTLSIIFSLLIVIFSISVILMLVIPQMVSTIGIFKDNIPSAFNTAKEWVLNVARNNPNFVEKVTAFSPNWEELDANITDTVKNALSGIINVSFTFASNFIKGIVNFFMGIIFAIYMLAQKEKLIEQLKKIVRSFLSEEKANKLFYIGSLSNSTFKDFIGGQILEAIILGTLCFIGMSILKLPYALNISLVVGVSNMIPVFGPIIGGLIGAIIILGVSPIKAIWFIIFVVAIQQVDGNLIYPKVVGNRVGLPGIWVMLAVLVGGNGFGILGMFVAVPVASIIYRLLRERVNNKQE